jgi:hypothetical protein
MLESRVLPVVLNHRQKVLAQLKLTDEDLHKDELFLTDEVIAAPARPMVSNYEKVPSK